MCSIEGTTDSRYDIETFCNINSFRGPDDSNTYIGRGVQFGHNLLKIQPNQENLPQPFITNNDNVLTYNGEIYGLGDNVFDVEWLANKIENDGIESLAKGVNGMWALSWFNVKENTITLCRDHFGQKPLYYVTTEIDNKDQLYFSSTILPLVNVLKNIHYPANENEPIEDVKGIQNIIRNNGFNIGYRTMWSGISRVMPGEIIKIKLGNKFKITRDNLWKLDKDFNLFPNYMWNKEEFEHITKKAIKQVCHAPGVNKTISLSGGLDSSLIASVAKEEENISACSIHWENEGIDEKAPERHLLKQHDITLETVRKNRLKHHTYKIDKKLAFNNKAVDEVIKSMGFIPSWDHQRLIPRLMNITIARAHQNKIYITGDCADEILTGYNGDYNKWCDPNIHEKFKQNEVSFYLTPELYKKIKDDSQVKDFFNEDLLSVDSVINGTFYNFLKHCDGFCTVIDHMCGYYGMESRMPFLHQEWVKYTLKIPGQEKLRIPFLSKERKKGYRHMQDQQFFLLGHYKSLFRDNFEGHYTDNVRNEHRKIGFSNPWDSRDSKKNKQIIREMIGLTKDELNKYIKNILVSEPKKKDLERKLMFWNRDRALLSYIGVDFRDIMGYDVLTKNRGEDE